MNRGKLTAFLDEHFSPAELDGLLANSDLRHLRKNLPSKPGGVSSAQYYLELLDLIEARPKVEARLQTLLILAKPDLDPVSAFADPPDEAAPEGQAAGARAPLGGADVLKFFRSLLAFLAAALLLSFGMVAYAGSVAPQIAGAANAICGAVVVGSLLIVGLFVERALGLVLKGQSVGTQQ